MVEVLLDSVAEFVKVLLDPLRRLLNIINSIVETPLDSVAELVEILLDSLGRVFDVVDGVVEAALDSVAELVETLLYIVAYVLGLTNTAAGPFGGVLGEIWILSVFG